MPSSFFEDGMGQGGRDDCADYCELQDDYVRILFPLSLCNTWRSVKLSSRLVLTDNRNSGNGQILRRNEQFIFQVILELHHSQLKKYSPDGEGISTKFDS